MQLIKKYLLALLIFFYFKSVGYSKLRLELLSGYISQSGKGGKQVYNGSGDQGLMVAEPMFFFDWQVNHNTNVSGNFLFDMLTGASDRIFDAATGASGAGGTDVTTGASGTVGTGGGEHDPNDNDSISRLASGSAGSSQAAKWESRNAFDLAASHKMRSWIISPSFGYSGEIDYKSTHGGINISKSFAEDNFTLSAGYYYFDDLMRNFDLAAMSLGNWEPKITRSLNLSASQILGRSDIMLIGGSLTEQSGRLAGNRNTIDLSGTRISEILPRTRNKLTSTTRYVHGFNDFLALHLDYRFYSDDWLILAHTLEPSFAIDLFEESGLLRLFYRHHVQSASKFYKDRFDTASDYMTSDSDLAGFYANEAGVGLSYRFETGEGAVFETIELGGTLLHYVRSNDLRATIFQVGVSGAF